MYDTFLGQYEWPPSSYKHFYFNATAATMQVWTLVLLGVLGVYECSKRCFHLWWNKR